MPRKKKDPSEKPEKAPRAPRARASAGAGAKKEAAPKRPRAAAAKKTDPKPLVPVRRTSNRQTLKASTASRAGRSWELPTRYGETKAVLLARDPYWIYAYWEVTTDQQSKAKAALGDEYARSSMVLRVFQSAGPEGGEPLFLYDVEVRPFITSWYLNVHHPDREYYVEVVQRSPSGRVFVHARSNLVTTPRDFATPSPEKKWHVPETLAKYFRRETRSQQTGVSSASVAEGMPFERFPSGKGL
jgi:hypothetical protein